VSDVGAHPELVDAARALEAERARPLPREADAQLLGAWLAIVRADGSAANVRLQKAMARKVARLRREYGSAQPITFASLIVLLVNGEDCGKGRL